MCRPLPNENVGFFMRSLIDLIKVTQTAYIFVILLNYAFVAYLLMAKWELNNAPLYLICVSSVFHRCFERLFFIPFHCDGATDAVVGAVCRCYWPKAFHNPATKMIYTVFVIRYAWRKRDMT